MPEPAYLVVGFIVSSVGFVMFMYGKKQRRPVQLGSGLLLLLFPFLVRDPALLGLTAGAVCLLAWVSVKAGL